MVIFLFSCGTCVYWFSCKNVHPVLLCLLCAPLPCRCWSIRWFFKASKPVISKHNLIAVPLHSQHSYKHIYSVQHLRQSIHFSKWQYQEEGANIGHTKSQLQTFFCFFCFPGARDFMLSVLITITKSVQVNGLVRPELGTLLFFCIYIYIYIFVCGTVRCVLSFLQHLKGLRNQWRSLGLCFATPSFTPTLLRSGHWRRL